jgi:preprotein translocase subunit YajC
MKKLFLGLLPVLAASPAFAQQASPGVSGNGAIQQLVIIGAIIVCFYFILWRPEKKRKTAMENMRSSMKKGDKVVAMGILGHVAKVNDESVILKTCDGSKIEFLKAAITEVHPNENSEEVAKEEVS